MDKQIESLGSFKAVKGVVGISHVLRLSGEAHGQSN